MVLGGVIYVSYLMGMPLHRVESRLAYLRVRLKPTYQLAICANSQIE